MSADLKGKNAVVFGVANKRSIAWSIAQGLQAAGMKLAITYQNERLEQEAKDLIESLPGAEGFMCDVSKDGEIDRLFATLDPLTRDVDVGGGKVPLAEGQPHSEGCSLAEAAFRGNSSFV